MSDNEDEVEFEPELVKKDPLSFNLTSDPNASKDRVSPDEAPKPEDSKPVNGADDKSDTNTPDGKKPTDDHSKPAPQINVKSPSPAPKKWSPEPQSLSSEPDAQPEEFVPYQPFSEEELKKRKEYGKYQRPPKKKIMLPVIIPWEHKKAIMTQTGMGAFGAKRKENTKVDKGSKPMVRDKDGESVLTLFNAPATSDSQKGMKQFGAFRSNTLKVKDTKELTQEQLKASNCVIPKQSGTNELPSQAHGNVVLWGTHRSQVPKIEWRRDMIGEMDGDSKTFISRFMAPNENNKAGSGDLDHGRPQIMKIKGEMPNDPRTHWEIPRIFDVRHNETHHPTGTGAGFSGLGAFRQVVPPEVIGGYDMNYDEWKACRSIIPMQTGPSPGTQAGTGGFEKHRDVVNKTKYGV